MVSRGQVKPVSFFFHSDAFLSLNFNIYRKAEKWNFMYWHQRSGQGESTMMQERRSPFTLSGPRFVFVCYLMTSNTVLLLGFGWKKKTRLRVVIIVTKGRTPWFEFLVIFYYFITGKKRRWHLVWKPHYIFEGKVGQMCHRSCTLVFGILCKL